MIDEKLALSVIEQTVETGISVALKKFKIKKVEFFRYMNSRPDLMNMLLANQALRTEIKADDMHDVASNEPNLDRARMILSTTQWTASRILHRKYGDRLSVDVTQSIDVKSASLEAARKRSEKFVAQEKAPSANIPHIVLEDLAPELANFGEVPHKVIDGVEDALAWAEAAIKTLPAISQPIPLTEEDDIFS